MKKRFGKQQATLLGLILMLGVGYMVLSLQQTSASIAGTPTISFSETQYSVRESDDVATVIVQLDITPTLTIQVDYETLEATATGNGADYENGFGTLTFSPNQLAQTITIDIRDDAVAEGTDDEFFYVKLSNPVGAQLSNNDTTIVLIEDNDGTAPTSTPVGPVYLDVYEPNNSQDTATDIVPGNSACAVTLWPTLDVDFFRFWGKTGLVYDVFTSDLQSGLDTSMQVYGPSGGLIGENDDLSINIRDSRVTFTANSEGYYYVRIVNEDPSDPANKTYCVEVDESAPPTPTPAPTLIPDADPCTNVGDVGNDSFETACLIELEATVQENFVPVSGSGSDNDYFRIWVKPGIQYTCETSNLSSYNDTNIILYNNNKEGMWIGNDDKAPGDFGSLVTYVADYQGWLYILVGPVNVPDYDISYLFTYELECTSLVPPTPTPIPTNTPYPYVPAAPTAIPTATPLPTSDISTPNPVVIQATNTPEPINVIQAVPIEPQPQPTPTPRAMPMRVIVYYDINNDFLPQLESEGVTQTAVALYDNSNGNLLSLGYTGDNGLVDFGTVESDGPVLVYVPYLNYTQLVFGNETGNNTSTLVRVVPLNTFTP